MFDRNDSLPLSLFLQGERQARLDSLVIKACKRGTMSGLAEWLSALGTWGTRLVRNLVASSASSITSTIVRSLTSASRGVGSNTPCATGGPTRGNIRESGNDIRRLQCDGR